MLWACVVLPDLARDASRGQALLAAWAYRYSSQVSTDFPDAILIEAEGSLGLFGPWPRFEAQLRDDLAALGFRHRIALAPTASGARVLAGHQDGLAITTMEILRRALAQVPVAYACLPPELSAAFEHLGLRTLGKLFALPRAALGKRYGPGLLDDLDRLRGFLPEVITPYRPPDVFDVRIELNYDTESSQALLFPLRRLTADLAAYLSGRDGGVQRFLVLLEHEGRADSEVAVGLLAPEREAALLFELAKGRLEQARVPAPVRGVRLLARELPPFVPGRIDLFEARPQQSMPWQRLRERLRARLGNEAVHGLAATPDHRPERAWRCGSDAGDGDAKARPLPLMRPTWLLARPIPLRDPQLQILAGPERLETGWWDGFDVRRDYYVVRTQQGQCAWAFCAAGERGPFMLHGWFA